jgi:predicted acylesterase/phospholipase RssA
LLELYLNDGETIFPGGGRVAHPRPGWLREGTRYVASELEEVLDHYLGDTLLTDALTGVVVTSYDLAHGEPVTLSSRAELGDVSDVTMVVAARATSAAPMFFMPEIIRDGERERMLVDGGLYANNPAVLGYLLGGQVAAREDLPLALVSLGTGTRPKRTAVPVAERAQMRDASAVARALLEAVSTGSGNLVHLLLARLADGERFRYWRLQTTVGSCSFTMDDSSPENVACLYERARDLVSERDEELSTITHALGT